MASLSTSGVAAKLERGAGGVRSAGRCAFRDVMNGQASPGELPRGQTFKPGVDRSNDEQPFRGMPVSYVDPTEPVAAEDWEVVHEGWLAEAGRRHAPQDPPGVPKSPAVPSRREHYMLNMIDFVGGAQ